MGTTLTSRPEKLFEELDYRDNDGIEVSLLWNRSDNSLAVYVSDCRDKSSFELAVEPQRARQVFFHPFAYARS